MNSTALKERLRADLKAAMQAKRGDEVRVLRQLIAALDNAEAVPIDSAPKQVRPGHGSAGAEAVRRDLDADSIATLLAAEIAARHAAAADYRAGGREVEADALESEVTIIERYR